MAAVLDRRMRIIELWASLFVVLAAVIVIAQVPLGRDLIASSIGVAALFACITTYQIRGVRTLILRTGRFYTRVGGQVVAVVERIRSGGLEVTVLSDVRDEASLGSSGRLVVVRTLSHKYVELNSNSKDLVRQAARLCRGS